MIEDLRQAAVQADPEGFWWVTAIAGGIAVVVLYQGLNAFWRLRLVLDTPRAKIRSAPQGYVELAGRASPHHTHITGPLTGLPCVWYRYRVQREEHSGRKNRWVTIDHGISAEPFLLDDGTGRCLIQPTDAETTCRNIDRWRGARRDTPRPSQSSWLSVGGRYRFTEERIVEGEDTYVLGHLETPRRGDAERERLTRALLRTWKRDPARMAVLAGTEDGEIDLATWEELRGKAREIAEQAEARLASQPTLSQVSRPDDPGRPYLISSLGELGLLGRLRWLALGGTLGFVLLASGVGLALVARLTAAG
ncbi:E3 Ubiquitin ligase [Thioflavicoccus mobilis 8321]|uniref:RING-type E3 ubiquitin transferase n=1 Tax=Thioflavicoccus mobilis 8321 TaxID=765912 RepID=L0H2X0_9GAMM|nr:E3 Ubiquitin ligase [Thioflavicoccus mobilis]AGA91980.1 E3 Ubiquitin ligase [Thioflavicoccus mobilis 8321]